MRVDFASAKYSHAPEIHCWKTKVMVRLLLNPLNFAVSPFSLELTQRYRPLGLVVKYYVHISLPCLVFITNLDILVFKPSQIPISGIISIHTHSIFYPGMIMTCLLKKKNPFSILKYNRSLYQKHLTIIL